MDFLCQATLFRGHEYKTPKSPRRTASRLLLLFLSRTFLLAWVASDPLNYLHIEMECLSAEYLSNLFSSRPQIFVAVEPKASGTSWIGFAKQCSGFDVTGYGNVFKDLFDYENFEKSPIIIASHVNLPTQLIDLMRNVPGSSVLLYVHREETDRLASALKHVVRMRICANPDNNILTPVFSQQKPFLRCILNETELVDKVLRHPRYEMWSSSDKLLGCKFWQTAEMLWPNLLFSDFANSDMLKKLISTTYCPHVNPVKMHLAHASGSGVFVLSVNGTHVPLDEWVAQKRLVMQYALKMGSNTDLDGAPLDQCLRPIHYLEKVISNCSSGVSRLL